MVEIKDIYSEKNKININDIANMLMNKDGVEDVRFFDENTVMLKCNNINSNDISEFINKELIENNNIKPSIVNHVYRIMQFGSDVYGVTI